MVHLTHILGLSTLNVLTVIFTTTLKNVFSFYKEHAFMKGSKSWPRRHRLKVARPSFQTKSISKMQCVQNIISCDMPQK